MSTLSSQQIPSEQELIDLTVQMCGEDNTDTPAKVITPPGAPPAILRKRIRPSMCEPTPHPNIKFVEDAQPEEDFTPVPTKKRMSLSKIYEKLEEVLEIQEWMYDFLTSCE